MISATALVQARKRLTGYDQSEIIGKTPRILQLSGTDKKVIDRLAIALKSGGKFEGKAINYKKDGYYQAGRSPWRYQFSAQCRA